MGIQKKSEPEYSNEVTPENFLDTLNETNLERLSSKELAALKDFLQDFEMDLGTMCSGTEAPVLVIKSLQKALLKKGVILKFVHRFSCEWVKGKREFAKVMIPGFHHQFGDAKELAFEDPVR